MHLAAKSTAIFCCRAAKMRRMLMCISVCAIVSVLGFVGVGGFWVVMRLPPLRLAEAAKVHVSHDGFASVCV